MRLFVAIDLPNDLRRRLGESLRGLKPSLPRARWVRARNLHLTLAFLGYRPAQDLAPLDGALTPVFRSRSPFSLSLGASGHFPERGWARVAWIGFAESPELIDLELAVRRALEQRLGDDPGERPFHPHLTAARCSPAWRPEAAEAWRDARPAGVGEPFEVDRGILFESRIGAGGASYSVVQTYPLEGATCSGRA